MIYALICFFLSAFFAGEKQEASIRKQKKAVKKGKGEISVDEVLSVIPFPRYDIQL